MKAISHIITLAALIFFGKSAKAQIYYQDIVPDEVLNTWDVRSYRIDTSASAVLNAGASGVINIWNEFGNQIDIVAFSNCEVLMNGSFPQALSLNQTISSTSSGAWAQPTYAVLNDGVGGYWVGVSDKYLGVRIKKSNQWYYGWIRMDVNVAGTSVTIKDYAYNALPNSFINAGQKVVTTGIAESKDPGSITIYPNPSHGNITIIKENENITVLELVNIYGDRVFQSEIKNKKTEVDLNFPDGMYFVYLRDDHKLMSKIVIKK